MLSYKRNVLEYYLVPSWPLLPIRGSCIVGVHASQISAISLKLWRQKLLHFQASQHICRCPPSVMVLFNPYPKGTGGKTSNDSMCIVPPSLSPKQAVGLCQKREDSLSVSAAEGWAVNFYSRIHFQYTHFSPTQPICKVSHFSNFYGTNPRFHNW